MCCRHAVEQAYRRMQDSGVPDLHAYQVALTIYRYNHPDDEMQVAEASVTRWTGYASFH